MPGWRLFGNAGECARGGQAAVPAPIPPKRPVQQLVAIKLPLRTRFCRLGCDTANGFRKAFVGDACEAGAMSAAADRRGLLKLMLRMPALRGQLQVLSAKNEGVLSLCGAFDDATDALERLRLSDPERHRLIILEYENICAEIEQDIIKICMSGSGASD